MCNFDYTVVAVSEGGALVSRFHHISWVAVVTPTDRPKSVCNRCVIEDFDGFFVLSRCFLVLFFCVCRGFCHRTESDLFLFSFTFKLHVEFL